MSDALACSGRVQRACVSLPVLRMVQHTVAKLEAWVSVGASLCVCAAQLIRFI